MNDMAQQEKYIRPLKLQKVPEQMQLDVGIIVARVGIMLRLTDEDVIDLMLGGDCVTKLGQRVEADKVRSKYEFELVKLDLQKDWVDARMKDFDFATDTLRRANDKSE